MYTICMPNVELIHVVDPLENIATGMTSKLTSTKLVEYVSNVEWYCTGKL